MASRGLVDSAHRRLVLELRLPLGLAHASLAFAVVSMVGFADGGYQPRTWRLTLLALLAIAAAALIARERIAVPRNGLVMLASLAALAAWTELSNLWSEVPSVSLPETERTLVYVAAVLALLVACGRSSLPYVLAGALGGITADCAYGLLKHAFWPPPRNPIEGTLLFEPLGYANGMGVFAAIGVVLVLGFVLWLRRRLHVALALAPLLVLVPTLALTNSRGALVALAFGLATALYAAGRLRSPFSLAPVLAAGLVVGLLLGSSGHAVSLVGSNRPRYWHVAWQVYEAKPVLGSGAGTFGNEWLHHRTTSEFVQDAHNLYLEMLTELGPLGLALVVVALAIPLLALRRRLSPLAAAAAGGYVTFLLHAVVDWDWELPAVTLVGLLCGVSLLMLDGAGRRVELGAPVRALLGAAVVALGVLASVRLGKLPF